ncbi:AMP-dependent synthetase and ligase [Pseudooceanicola batsensis HTCC2597]|uniref:AMP-dependent synthetase and ligase n=1 Tax=Pseudooceanicola batsensis (strain ATCC BAA-863 / DSM 15984 / KCTC 12145 / HTCC2597) TaxID=252305 RepID=A3TSQ8_PSEBH|nr:AMP-binding protein [Pseudooceanicola batsensis]EAQ04685.1 AMP-dependent synthetase and ligase [Pseudooceanicola batsensis HTCC2597]
MLEVLESPTSEETSDPRVPARDSVVTRYLIDRWARERPDKIFAKFNDDGEEWSYAAFRELIVQTAVGLQAQGVAQGDHVLVWMPNCREQIRIFFALNYLGAVYVPINTAYKGGLLEHVIDISDARLAVVDASLVDRLEGVDHGRLESLIVTGGSVDKPPLPHVHYAEALLPESGQLQPLTRAIDPWDSMAIIFTSGTTGPSKGVLTSYLHLFSNAGPESWPFVTEDDRYMINAPMFHIGGMGPMFCMLARGASIAFVDRFDTATYWESVRNTGSTVAFLLGVMASFLEKQPVGPQDADNPLRLVLMVPLAANSESFSKRFGVDVYTIFNMTEASTPIVSEPNPTVRGTCGKPRDGVEVRLVDENDCEVPVGTMGEMIIRTDRPWAMNSGYYKMPEATAKAWRNGWFHSGDAFVRDEKGNFFFADRMKDSIRRRGENISSFEVESEVLAHPDVFEAAAVAVPSEHSEDDVMICIAPVEGKTVDPAQLIDFLKDRMAYFMVPRYVRTLDTLPKTPSAKVLKHELRATGVTEDTWDRDAAGVSLKSERFARA